VDFIANANAKESLTLFVTLLPIVLGR